MSRIFATVISGLVGCLLAAGIAEAGSKVTLEATARTVAGPARVELGPGESAELSRSGPPSVCATVVAEAGSVHLENELDSDKTIEIREGEMASACGEGALSVQCDAPGKKGACAARYRVDLLSRSYELQVSVGLPNGVLEPGVKNTTLGLSCYKGSCFKEVSDDTSVVLVAAPVAECGGPAQCGGPGRLFVFKSWVGCDEVLSDLACVVRMKSDREIEANYSATP